MDVIIDIKFSVSEALGKFNMHVCLHVVLLAAFTSLLMREQTMDVFSYVT